MAGSGATSGLVLAFSTAPDGLAVAARGTSPARGGCAGGPAVTGGWVHDHRPPGRALARRMHRVRAAAAGGAGPRPRPPAGAGEPRRGAPRGVLARGWARA